MVLALALCALLSSTSAFSGLPTPLTLRSGRAGSCLAPLQRQNGRSVQLGMMADGGDLFEGLFEERNQQVQALKKAFYSPGASPDTSSAASFVQPGQHDLMGVKPDMPLCRWRWTVLPGYQSVLNVWQPQYTHMFEGVLSGPGPWEYVHCFLPGGTENLGKPEFELRIGTQAPLVGTLMRIMAVRRNEDSTLTLVVQGRARVRVLNQTQSLPYSRADVQFLPDAEIWEQWQRAAGDALGQLSLEDADSECAADDSRSFGNNAVWRRTVALSGAVAEDAAWAALEQGGAFAGPIELPPVLTNGPEVVGGAILEPIDLTLVPPIVPLNKTAGLAARVAQLFPAAVHEAVAAGAASAVAAASKVERQSLEETFLDAGDKHGQLRPVLSLDDMVDAGVLRSAGEAVEIGDVNQYEIRVWVELDALIRNLAVVTADQGRSMPVPTQLLHLLPPPPPLGWPEAFAFKQIKEEQEREGVQEDITAHYPAQRRQQRFSYLVFTVLGENPDLQQVLESKSTAGRLAVALQWFTGLNAALRRQAQGGEDAAK